MLDNRWNVERKHRAFRALVAEWRRNPGAFDLDEFELPLWDCDYLNGRGYCSFGCRDEPACQTLEPGNGWDGHLESLRSEVAA